MREIREIIKQLENDNKRRKATIKYYKKIIDTLTEILNFNLKPEDGIKIMRHIYNDDVLELEKTLKTLKAQTPKTSSKYPNNLNSEGLRTLEYLRQHGHSEREIQNYLEGHGERFLRGRVTAV